MSKTGSFYQLGGFGSHTNRWRYSPFQELFLYPQDLARTLHPVDVPPLGCLLNEHNQLELTLGVTQNGASYLLIADDKFQALLHHLQIPQHQWPRDKPFITTNYLSISPITFPSQESLIKKLSSLQPKANKQKRASKQEQRTDVSRANERFYLDNDRGKQLFIGRRRALFESWRVMHRAIHSQIPLQTYTKQWEGTVRGILTLSFNLWHRPEDGPEGSPRDVAWAKLSVDEQENKPQKVLNLHDIVYHENPEDMLLSNGQDRYYDEARAAFKYGNPASKSPMEYKRDLKQLFDDVKKGHEASPTHPVVLIIHDFQSALNVLRYFDIDTSSWSLDLEDLLQVQRGLAEYDGVQGQKNETKGKSREPADQDYERDILRHRRERSRSPVRGESYHSNQERSSRYGNPNCLPSPNYYLHSTHNPDRELPTSKNHHEPPPEGGSSENRDYGKRRDLFRRSPSPYTPQPGPGTSAAVYVADTKMLFAALTGRNSSSDPLSFREVCCKLGLVSQDEGWCVGNDARYLYEVWNSLLGGPCIDDREEERTRTLALSREAASKPRALPRRAPPAAVVPPTRIQAPDILDGAEASGLHGSGGPNILHGLDPSMLPHNVREKAKPAIDRFAADWDDLSDGSDG